MVETYAEKDVTQSLAYLFYGTDKPLTHLEEETYLLQALNSNLQRIGFIPESEIPGTAYVTRWPENKFPLKVCAIPDYGFLFNPMELKHLQQLVQQTLVRLEAVDPEVFKFKLTFERDEADILIKWRRTESQFMSHCVPIIGREKQIKSAEIIVNISARSLVSAVNSAPLTLDLMHNLQHALGVFGHSSNPMDSGYKCWNASQLILTPRDAKTLQLLYRCPIGMTKSDLMLLWAEYHTKYLTGADNEILENLLSNTPLKIETIFPPREQYKRPSELSTREIALQESFLKSIKSLKTA